MKKFTRIFALWGKSLKALFTAPRIWVPLSIMGLIHLGILYTLYLFPRYPVKVVTGPIVRRFWGETYMHYPFNFIILPYLAKMSRQILSVFFDFYFLGVLAVLGGDFWRKRRINLKSAFKESLMKFFPLLAYSVTLVIILYVVQKVPPYLFKTIYNSPLIAEKNPIFYAHVNDGLYYGLKIVAAVVQVFFIFTIPLLVIGDRGLLRSVDYSIQLSLKNFFTTLFIVLVPTLLVLGLDTWVKTPKPMIENYFPEMVYLVLLCSETLYILGSYLIIVPVTGLYLDSLGRD